MHGITGVNEPDLILTDDRGLIDASNTGNNEDIGYMGLLSVLLQWHEEDPVDEFETQRNDIIFSFQGNRNPFIDHPEWVACVFQGACKSAIDNLAGLSGLWYDSTLDGEGYNIIVADAGIVIFFYGYSAAGERVWLLTETYAAEVSFGQSFTLQVYEVNGGTFAMLSMAISLDPLADNEIDPPSGC